MEAPEDVRLLSQDDDIGDEKEHVYGTPTKKRSYNRKLFITSHLVLLGLYVLGLYLVWNKEPSTKACAKRLSTHSPALPIAEYLPPYHLDAAIVQVNKYRGPPSPEIDAEWEKIGAGVPGVRLQWDDIIALNKSVQTDPMKPLHRIPEEFGGGYIGMLEVFHLLHCLDEVRKATYPEHYAAEWEAHGGVHAARIHNDHCIDMLREMIMCDTDVTPVTFYDPLGMSNRKLPMPDFNTLHTCRNFEAVLEWNNNNERAIQWDEIGLEIDEEHGGHSPHAGRAVRRYA